MKKFLAGVVLALVLTGCSLGEMNDSIDYGNDAKEHINQLKEYAEGAQERYKEASKDPEAKEKLANELKSLKDDINAFNNIDAPSIAEDLHKNIVSKNEQIIAEIDAVFEDGQLALEKVQDSKLIQTIRNTSEIINQLENLNQ
ncbi:DUF6376 family protein [Pontibacillus marinus]|uniref:Lipoprotein n=1 Tax=Pontibacillus marinus BH030004 = DSM 16465 TaxID=1385511 RepID=A0A0A5G3I3_9BACI|nr:DUF6376 family protein [Pontibacillus marinus]KGX85640.1 hypothetical protein N783_14190 [Pontibacillus marinus BH030004 = DSM 16465]